jgi:dolichol-phosphate mannosyltransferase
MVKSGHLRYAVPKLEKETRMKSVPELTVVVPTYNEAPNVEALVTRVDSALRDTVEYELLFVDDNSPDGTAAVAQRLAKAYPVRVIVRTEDRGLAQSVSEGFRQARGDLVAVIDADLQHPPERLPDLVAKARNGADVVVGSRYEAGGGVEGWTLNRKLVSRGARLLAYMVTPTSRKSTDPLSGFFLVRKSAIEGVVLRPVGYKILLEILVRGRANRVEAVPYMFADRTAGESKYGLREQWNYLRHLARLAPADPGLRRFVKFCIVGGSGVLVNMGLLWLLTEVAGLFYLVSSVVAVETAIVNNFVWNDVWTFHDRRRPGRAERLKRLARFNAVSVGGLGINVAVLWLLTEQLGMHYLVSNLFGIAAATLWNFFMNAVWTWRTLPSSS